MAALRLLRRPDRSLCLSDLPEGDAEDAVEAIGAWHAFLLRRAHFGPCEDRVFLNWPTPGWGGRKRTLERAAGYPDSPPR